MADRAPKTDATAAAALLDVAARAGSLGGETFVSYAGTAASHVGSLLWFVGGSVVGFASEKVSNQVRRISRPYLEPNTPWYWQGELASGHSVQAVPDLGLDRIFEAMLRPGETIGEGPDLAYPHPVGYKNFEFVKAWRIENPSLWRTYHAQREDLHRKVGRLRGIPVDIFNVPEPPSRMGFSDLAAEGLPCKPANEVNEVWLAHATTPDKIMQIISQGFNGNLAAKGLFGMGTYFAEDVGKCDQYATPDRNFRDREEVRMLHDLLYPGGASTHPEDVFYVFICRVLLGAFVSTADGKVDGGGRRIWRGEETDPRSARELTTIPGSEPPEPFHALVVQKGIRLKRYREFITFHGSTRAYPEYLMAYRRVPPRLP